MKVFIINLEKSIDRRESMQSNISRWQEKNLEHKDKVEFIFHKAQTPEDIKNNGFIKRYNRFLAYLWKGRDVRETELAAFASHLSLWEKCVELNEPIFILEDDVDFMSNFFDGLCNIYNSKYDYVKLVWSTFRKMCLVEEHFAFAHPLVLGAGGYYITPNAAKRFVKHANRIYIALDYYISHSFIHGVVEMLYIPHIVEFGKLNDNSTIGIPSTDRSKIEYKLMLIPREFHRIYRQIRTVMFLLKNLPRM